MKLQTPTSPNRSTLRFLGRAGTAVAALGTLAVCIGLVPRRAQADVWDKKTVLTVDQPIQVTDTYLEPGTYVFKLANSSSDRHIVYIYNAAENKLINTVMAIPNYRVQPTGGSRFTFWETPPGTARAVRDWFYPGDNFGQEFRYPKHLHTLAVAYAPAPAPPAPVAPAPEPEAQAPAPAPETAVQTPAPAPEPAPEAQVEIAQNTPPPPPPAVETPAPAPAAPPQELPKTATPYPSVGLGGLILLGLYGLLRVRGVA